MNYRLAVTHDDLKDLDEVSQLYDLQQPGVGQDFRNEIDGIFDEITFNPKMYNATFRGVRKGYRGRFPYIVYYRIMGDEVGVFAVLHASRHSSAWTSHLP